jgi:3-methyladenine DNA glycosylase AlkD
VYSKEPGVQDAIQSLIKPLENDKEYYVKKAIVWLRKNMEKHS